MNRLWKTLAVCAGMTFLVAGCSTANQSQSTSQQSTLAAEDADSADEQILQQEAQKSDDADAAEPVETTIEPTEILDDENITARITYLECRHDHFIVLTATNNSTETLLISPRIAVNGCMTEHGYMRQGNISIAPGTTSTASFALYDEQYYGIYPEQQDVRFLDIALNIQSADSYIAYDTNGNPIDTASGGDADAADVAGETSGLSYAPATNYDSAFVRIDTNLASTESTDIETAPAEGTALVDQDGISIQFVDLVQILDDRYAYVFYAENTNDTACSIVALGVSVNGVALPADCSAFQAETDSALNSVGGVATRITNLDQIVALENEAPFAALTIAPHDCGYLIMPLNQDALEDAGVTLPLTDAEMTFSIASADAAPVILTAAVTADSTDAERKVPLHSPELITNSTAYHFDVTADLKYITHDENDDYLAAALHDLVGIDLSCVENQSEILQYTYSAGDSPYGNIEGPSKEGYARSWEIRLLPYGPDATADEISAAAFSETFLSSLKAVLIEAGYPDDDDTDGISIGGDPTNERTYVIIGSGDHGQYVDISVSEQEIMYIPE